MFDVIANILKHFVNKKRFRGVFIPYSELNPDKNFQKVIRMKMIFHFFVALVFLTIGFARVAAQTSSVEQKEGDLRWQPYKIAVEGKSVDGELGRLAVRENREKPNSRLIEVAFVRLKSTAEKPGFPVIYLDGGPGSSPLGLARVPEYMAAFQKLREVGDVILLDQRGIGLSKPNLTRATPQSLPIDIFANKEKAQAEYTRRFREAAEYFRSQGVDLSGYNSRESAHDVDDIRKALGAAKMNLVGFSYGTHLTFACLRYHSQTINRAAVFGSEGPNHTEKLPSTSDEAVRRLARIVATNPEIGPKMPDLYATLKRVLEKFAKEPAKVTVTDRKTGQPVELLIDDDGLRFLIRIDLGDTNDLPIFPAWFYSMDNGDYSILSRFAERRYNQFGAGAPVMTVLVDNASGASADRKKKIEKEDKTAILGNIVNFPSFEIPGITDGMDLGDEYRRPLKTGVPTLFVSGDLDNNTQPFQADEIRKTFKTSTHIIIGNAGHESTFVVPQIQQMMADFLNGKDVATFKFSHPPLKFLPLPESKRQ
ncbi:MAG: alpha/beta hydrolase [Pyrinomonadaceae bacterium]